MAGIERKSLSQPDERADYGDQGSAAKVTVGVPGFGFGNESTVWLSTLQPGWSWQRNIKPNVPFESCPLHHREYVISGRIRYVLDDGSAVEAGAGDHMLIDPGHQAEVINGQVGGGMSGTLVARAPVAVLTTPGPQHAGAEPLPGSRAVQGVVLAAVGLPGVVSAAATRAAGDDTADRAQLHPRIVDGVGGAVYSL